HMENLETLLNVGAIKRKRSEGEPRRIKRCAAYVRVSSEEQAENPEGSIRNQEERIRQALSFKNSSAEFGQLDYVFIERGISAKDMNRPELRKMLELIGRGKIDVIIVSEMS